MKLEHMSGGCSLVGVEPAQAATVVTVVPLGDAAATLIYKTPDGTLKDRLLNRADEAGINPATTERPWSFDGDAEAIKLTVEAKRIDIAFLFDPMMGVHTSNVEPLPHQITAVYESMLPRQPLRFVLADDLGAGKTIMAGLYNRELIMRADARRILVVAPGDWEPRSNHRLPVWEALHHLLRALKQGGESASGALLAGLGGRRRLSVSFLIASTPFASASPGPKTLAPTTNSSPVGLASNPLLPRPNQPTSNCPALKNKGLPC